MWQFFCNFLLFSIVGHLTLLYNNSTLHLYLAPVMVLRASFSMLVRISRSSWLPESNITFPYSITGWTKVKYSISRLRLHSLNLCFWIHPNHFLAFVAISEICFFQVKFLVKNRRKCLSAMFYQGNLHWCGTRRQWTGLYLAVRSPDVFLMDIYLIFLLLHANNNPFYMAMSLSVELLWYFKQANFTNLWIGLLHMNLYVLGKWSITQFHWWVRKVAWPSKLPPIFYNYLFHKFVKYIVCFPLLFSIGAKEEGAQV